MSEGYLSMPEAEDLWSKIYARPLGDNQKTTFHEPARPEYGSFRTLPPGHLAIYPDAPRIIEEQLNSGSSD